MSTAKRRTSGNPQARPKDKPWTPFERRQRIPTGEWIWQNSRFTVIVGKADGQHVGWEGMEGDFDVHLSYRRNDRSSDRITWRDVQRMKSELCGSEAEALEVYPAESRVLDGANQRHLLVWRADNPNRPRYGFHTGRQVNDAETLKAEIEADPEYKQQLIAGLAMQGTSLDALQNKAFNEPFEDGKDVNLGHDGLIW